MSTSCTFPKSLDSSFRIAREAGFDGMETMVGTDSATRSPDALKALIDKYELPILSIHAPVLLVTQFVWGRDQQVKLERTAELAREVGASTVVVHPPFRWHRGYAERFLDIVRATGEQTGVTIAVENMFPWTVGGRALDIYLPGIDPTRMACDAICLDFSHAALAGESALELAERAGDRLRHIHLCDGTGPKIDGDTGATKMFDEHLLPGRGRQPVAETLQHLAANGWEGDIVAEVKTHRAKNEAQRIELLRETLAFARKHLGLATPR